MGDLFPNLPNLLSYGSSFSKLITKGNFNDILIHLIALTTVELQPNFTDD